MDLRIQKTRNSIFSSFIELRAVKPLEKITIKELTDRANISKQTFYLHFKDIYDLSNYLEDDAVASLIKDIPNPEFMISNPSEAAKQMCQAFLSQGNLFRILFANKNNADASPTSTYGSLAEKIEYKIKELIYEIHPEYRDDIKKNIFLTFIIHGSINAFFAYGEDNPEEAIAALGDLVHNTVNNQPE